MPVYFVLWGSVYTEVAPRPRGSKLTEPAYSNIGHGLSILYVPLEYELAPSRWRPDINQDACVYTYATPSLDLFRPFVHDQHITNRLPSFNLTRPLFVTGSHPPLYIHGGRPCAAENRRHPDDLPRA
jgi:hypothetical protein